MLLISEYVLDCIEYNYKIDKYYPITWAQSTLRDWLNDDFYNEAFDNDSKRIILDSEVNPDNNAEYSTYQGVSTTDKIFLLSINEAEKYMDVDNRISKPTEYTKTLLNGKTYANEAIWWWLRTVGCGDCYAAGVDSRGKLDYDGSLYDRDDAGIRPAMWVDVNKLDEK